MKDLTIGFIGLGLIGGSIARGIKRSRRDVRIMAYMRSRDKLEQAKRDGVVDVILDGIGEEIEEIADHLVAVSGRGADERPMVGLTEAATDEARSLETAS